MSAALEVVPGLRYVPGYLDRGGQVTLLAAIRDIVTAAPLFTPTMPRSGAPFSVRMSNCGPLGWMSDRGGYRYGPTHPGDRPRLAAVPAAAPDRLGCARRLSRATRGLPGELLRRRGEDGPAPGPRRGELRCPVVSLSLGDTCVFRYGGPQEAWRRRKA